MNAMNMSLFRFMVRHTGPDFHRDKLQPVSSVLNFLKLLDVLASLTPPPFGRPAGVYPVLDTGQE